MEPAYVAASHGGGVAYRVGGGHTSVGLAYTRSRWQAEGWHAVEEQDLNSVSEGHSWTGAENHAAGYAAAVGEGGMHRSG